ncbi:hypothetical protein PT974_00586 [Cladobotryum mycophilum]|uniref:Uncharacterized protein n=1 Tax=Cladobotryum mycophilum TaxID=491253 RepID=A0ABR0T1C3_9HYPO
MAVSEIDLPRSSRKHKAHRNFASSKTSFSGRSKLRPQISAPFEFRHLESASFQFSAPGQQLPRVWEPSQTRPASFRPLELALYTPENETSPILPYFNTPKTRTPPMRSHFSDRPLSRRKPPSSTEDDARPKIPPKSRNRTRGYTASEMEVIKERVAHAMNEVEQLQQKINEIMERQSLYALSRSSTSNSATYTLPGPEEMPSVPALPPAAPSFAERLNAEMEQPQATPIDELLQLNQSKASIAVPIMAETFASDAREDIPLAPPLPLVLRPPLRKKKSFSRVSTWLFPEAKHSRDFSPDSVTKIPRPVKVHDEFYQYISPDEKPSRTSGDSCDTVSTWETDEEARTVPTTTWSPESTPATKKEERTLQRSANFDERSHNRPDSTSVGVAI